MENRIYRIIEPRTEKELEKYYNLRYEILRKPWNQPIASTKDGEENISVHLLMIEENGIALAAGRLQINSAEEGQIRSMAVREDMQGKGLGQKVIERIEEIARERNLKTILLDARINAVSFYEKNGYTVIGDSYLLFGVIKHFRMKKEI